MCVSAVATIWTGYPYLLIIVLVYFLLQLVVDRFRGADSMGVVISVTVMWVVGFLVMMPVYYFMDYWATWFDMPVVLFVIAVVVGLIFMATRDLPWILVLPAIAALAIVGLLALSVLAPSIFNAVISGQGYLVKSKLYSTISEAQAPVFSNLVMSFGALTFWLALIGVGYAAVKMIKSANPFFVFIIVYGAVSIYMAASAGRFLFNAAPAIAILAGWILVMVIGFAKFDEFFHAISQTLRSPKAFLRKLANIKVILLTFILVFLLIVPNVWTAMDAGIPSETKKEYDLQIYKALPAFIHPSEYDSINGSFWYLGAFSYSLPTPDKYWPAAWSWFKTRDANITEDEDKPAFLSWWDYGFEAVQEGKHPTVADNFQSAYQYAGTFICAQNETQAIAMFIIRAVESVDRSSANWTAILDALDDAGVNSSKFQDVMDRPTTYTAYVLAHPEIFGPYDSEISALNVKYAMASHVLLTAGSENLVEVYNYARTITGNDIGYFAIDSRLFPFSATSSNIFYAPVKLSDRRVDPTTNDPIDFYKIVAIDQYGNEYDLADVPVNAVIVDYQIVYKDMFYQSMLYRAFMGFSPSDIGKTEQGIPGISGSLASYSAMPAWNMTHFRMVYRTAYFNPWSEAEVANHSADWRAISYDVALIYDEMINEGTMNGTVDLSSASLMSGVVFIQYYDGVIIQGNALSEDGDPMAGIWVTVLDEYGIPHNTVKTDENGYYKVIAPFGKVDVVYSYGLLDLRTQMATEITRTTYNFTYEQAMRKSSTGSQTVLGTYSEESDPDWIINGTIVLKSGNLSGKVYLNTNSATTYEEASDVLLLNATVVIRDKATGFTRSTIAVNGTYSFVGLPPMSGATIYAVYQNHTIGTKTTSVSPGKTTTTDIFVKSSSFTATITLPWGTPAAGISVDITDQASGIVTTQVTSPAGKVTFAQLLPGNYTIQAHDSAFTLGPKKIEVSAGSTLADDLVLYDAMYVSGQVMSGANAVPYAKVGFISARGETWVTADANGHYSAVLPRINQTIYAIAVLGGQEKVYLAQVVATSTVVVN
ncbi:MAG TPA: carboxypeptidase regulatory-like domain-containing protein, partial [Methanomassiliicoccales archaeon]|nr:carboxypeptidase regulatory-like domain-containing protein [Methanomassiliicoccales archaeon]